VATALFGERKPRPTRAESHTLPTPGDARTAPLSGPDRRGGEGWRWLNPLPRALPTYLGLDVGGPGLVAMVGRRGAAARITPQGLAAWASGTTEDLEAVTYAGAREALAVGARGTIVRLGEGPPVNLASGTTQALHAVAAVSPTEAIAAGDAGTLLRIVDRRVTPLDAAAATGGAALRAVAVVGADVVAVGEAGTIVRIGTEGVSRERNANRATLRGVGGCAGGTLYAAAWCSVAWPRTTGVRCATRGRLRGRPSTAMVIGSRSRGAAARCCSSKAIARCASGAARTARGTRSQGPVASARGSWAQAGASPRFTTITSVC
jgi:hypothetical protein